MKLDRLRWFVAAKVVLAVVSFSALIGLVGANMAPSLPLPTLLLNVFLGALAILGVLLPMVLISLTLGQVALNKGGADPEWFWFPSEPRGLVQLREEAAGKRGPSVS